MCFNLRPLFLHYVLRYMSNLRGKWAAAPGLHSRNTFCCFYHQGEELFGVYSLLNYLLFASYSWVFCLSVLWKPLHLQRFVED